MGIKDPDTGEIYSTKDIVGGVQMSFEYEGNNIFVIFYNTKHSGLYDPFCRAHEEAEAIMEMELKEELVAEDLLPSTTYKRETSADLVGLRYLQKKEFSQEDIRKLMQSNISDVDAWEEAKALFRDHYSQF